MKKTFKEKLEFNKNNGTGFSNGYYIGAKFYQDYIKADSEYKQTIKEFIDTCSFFAKKGDEYGKGCMCGVRDAANERKARQRK